MNTSNASDTNTVNRHSITRRREPSLPGARPLLSRLRRRRSLLQPGTSGAGLVLLAFWLSCVPLARARINLVATLPDYGAIAQEIGGDLVQVTVLARGTEDPHFVDARPSFIRALNRADALLEGGADLEVGWLPPLINTARNPKILGEVPGHIVMSRGIRMLDVPSGPVDRSMGDVHPAGNPHYNLDPENGLVMAANLAESLSRLDAANGARYQANLKRFTDRLKLKLAEWSRILEPYRGTKVVTYHKSFDYLLNRYGLVLAGTIEPKPGIEPSPAHVNALIPQAKAAGVQVVLIEINRPRKTPTFLAESIGAKLVLLPGLVGGARGTGDYVSFIDHIVQELSAALKPSSK